MSSRPAPHVGAEAMALLLANADLHQAFWTILVASVAGVACALLGCFLVLRRLSLMGDALSHGVLPGIALAVLISGKITSVWLLAGAMVFGVLTAFLAETLHTGARVSEDASLGVVYTSLFALGVIVISLWVPHTDLDLDCVFYGILEYAPIYTVDFLGVKVPRALPTMTLSLMIISAFILLFWKELKIVSFDPALATAMGLSARLMHYLLMALVAGASVTAFEAVGVIQVLTMLVVPAATAYLLVERLAPMLLWSAVLAVTSSVFGYLLAWRHVFACNVGGMIAAAAGVQLLAAVLFSPRQGVVVRAWRRWQLAQRIAAEEILAGLYRAEEGLPAAPERELHAHAIPAWTARLARRGLLRHGLIAHGAAGLMLTDAGRKKAADVVRAHRLWEAFLEKNFDLPPDHLHEPASRIEHFLGPKLQERLAQELQQPQVDPHGRAIPPVEGAQEK